MGRIGTGGDLNFHQAPSLLVYKEFETRPIPQVENDLKLQNMKQWQCGVFQLCDSYGQPLEAPLAYAMYFNQLCTVTNWICTGEHNDDGIFHVHAMFKTGVRSDSLRRSMLTQWQNLNLSETWQQHFGQEPQFECLKLQRCHKPEALLGYIMKGPKWVLSNSEQLLQLAYDVDMLGFNDRFKHQEEPDLA